MELTKSQIEEINMKSPYYDQGVFVEPYSIPSHIKEPVIYMRWKKSGMSGGSCWGSKAKYYENSEPTFKVLDLVLMELKPNLSYLQFKLVEELIQKTEDTDYEYYGNCTDWDISYIILSELIVLLESF